MMHASPYRRARANFLAAWRNRALRGKAVSFALIGVVNALVDYCVFLVARIVLVSSSTALAAFGSLSDFCQCASATTVSLIAANALSWIVAVSGSYVMNSSITFAAES
jgi:putative flippase GtrA